MNFSYKARNRTGELQVGNVEAETREAAAAILLGHGLYVLSLESGERKDLLGGGLQKILHRVKAADLMVFTRQFATMLDAQVSLSDSLSGLYRQTTNPILREAIAAISDDVAAGNSLSHALGRQSGIFSEFYVNMVKSAEVTGRLSEVLSFLADYLEHQAELVSKVKNAVSYPAFIIGLFVVVMVVMMTVVLPQIAPIFTESNVEIPAFTKIMLGIGNILKGWWWMILVLFGLLGFVLYDYFQSAEGRAVRDEVVFKIPVMGGMFRKMFIARFAESARVLVQGGLTIPQAIEVSAHTIGNVVYREALLSAADEVRRGKMLNQALSGSREFPPLVAQLVSVGEATGRLQELLEKITLFYTREVENTVDNLVTLIQPILMILIGGMIALLFGSIMAPIFDLSKSFGV